MDQKLVDRIRTILDRASCTVEFVATGPASGHFQPLHPLAESLEFFKRNTGTRSVRWGYGRSGGGQIEIELGADGAVRMFARPHGVLYPEHFSEQQIEAFSQLLSEIESLLDAIERGMQSNALEALLKS